MTELAYVNGAYSPIADAKISIDDRGLQFGDGVYEVIYALNGRPFMLEGHMNRLARSLAGLSIVDVDIKEIESVICELAKKGEAKRSKIYLSVTRGTAPRNHVFPKNTRPNVIATIRDVPEPPKELIEKGIKAVTMPDLRWGRCDLKTLNLLWNVMAKQKAESLGAQEALLVSNTGIVREGTSSNVFIVHRGRARTHPCDEHILPGITRDLLITLANKNGIEISENPATIEQLRDADEIFITGTVAELAAVTSLDGKTVGDGLPGKLYWKLRELYLAYLKDFLSRS